jgi:hypothetical protein
MSITFTRPLMLAATALVMVGASLLAIPISTAAPTLGEEAPALEANDDSYNLWAGTHIDSLEVFLNDPAWDVEGSTIGGLQLPEIIDETKVRLFQGGILLDIDPRRSEDLIFDYKWVNEGTGEESNWATVIITVKRTYDIKTKQPRRLKIKLINRNTGRVTCNVGSNSESTPDISVWIKAKSSRVVTNRHAHKRMYLNCAIGKYYATVTERMLRGLKV